MRFTGEQIQAMKRTAEEICKMPPEGLAKPSCNHCYGTGVFGMVTNKDGERSTLLCTCLKKERVRLFTEARKKALGL